MPQVIKIILTVLALIYVVSPYDALPDMIPLLGRGDDLFVLGALLAYVWRIPIFRAILGLFFGRDRSEPKDNARAGIGGREGNDVEFDPWEVLGIAPGADLDEIKKAYRKASQQYHPDKVTHLGPELQELANRKYLEIQRAYQELTSHID